MRIVSSGNENLFSFGILDDGDVFQREDSAKLYLKSSHSSGEGGNAVRLSSGKRITVQDDEVVELRDDAQVSFGKAIEDSGAILQPKQDVCTCPVEIPPEEELPF